jgi:hypothetical protein
MCYFSIGKDLYQVHTDPYLVELKLVSRIIVIAAKNLYLQYRYIVNQHRYRPPKVRVPAGAGTGTVEYQHS